MTRARARESVGDRVGAALGRAGYAVGWMRGWWADEEASLGHALRVDLGQLVHDVERRLETWATDHLVEIFALLRIVKPILVARGTAIVTRFDDVEEVLSRDQVFTVPYAPAFAALTEGGSFLLGLDGTAAYARDASTLQKVARREDIPTLVVPIVSGAAAAAVSRCGGALDVMRDLGEVVLTALVAEYFGTPSPAGADGPASDSLARWSATMSSYLFLQATNNGALEQQALDAARQMRGRLAQIIATRKQHRGMRVDVLERLLVLQDAGLPGCDDISIRNMLLGLVVAAIPTTSAAVALVVDELLRRPQELAGAQAAARANDDRTLAAYAFEAMRLNPLAPGVFRVASDDYEIASGTWRATRVPKGTRVFAALQSAMMDDRELDHPGTFRLDRPPYQNLLFGYGLHTCFGRHINAVQIPLIVKALLVRQDLRRADGAAGTLRRDNGFPVSLGVRFRA
jgi:cytochrome P450